MEKIIISINMKLKTPLHVGTGEGNGFTDAICYRNGRGQLAIPGSSIGGAFRSRAMYLKKFLNPDQLCKLEESKPDLNEPCTCVVCRLFGNMNPEVKDIKGKRTVSSKLLFHDVIFGCEASTLIRDGIAMDRETNTADEKQAAKYDFEYVSAGCASQLVIEAKGMAEAERKLLEALLEELKEGRICFGGNSSRGLGRVTVDKISKTEVPQLSKYSIKEYVAFLKRDDWKMIESDEKFKWEPEKSSADKRCEGLELQADDVLEFADMEKIAHLEITGKLYFNRKFLTNDNVFWLAEGYDSAPALTKTKKDNMVAYIQGGSIRGSLRTQAERIANTLGPEFKRLVSNMFGSSDHGSRLKVSDSFQMQDNSSQIKEANLDVIRKQKQDFVAIDRFTGGAADKKKFDTIYLQDVAFDLYIALEEPKPTEIALLLFLLRDIEDGLIKFGANKNKGYGKAILDTPTMKTYHFLENYCGRIQKSGIFVMQNIKLGVQQKKCKLIEDCFLKWSEQFQEEGGCDVGK